MLTDIYSPENIARSRARAEEIRAKVAEGELDAEDWLRAADEIETYAAEREALANFDPTVDPADATICEACE